MGDPALSLDAIIAKAVADAVRDASARAANEVASAALYYDQDSAPVARSCYLRAARAGAFPNSRVGNAVLAKRADVDAWIASKARAKRTPPKEDDSDEALLANAGFHKTR